MMLPKFRSITSKLLAIYLPIATSAAVAMYLAAGIHTFFGDRDALISQVQETANSNAVLLASAIEERDSNQIEDIAKGLAKGPSIKGVTVYGPSGEVYVDIGQSAAQTGLREISVNHTVLPLINYEELAPAAGPGIDPAVVNAVIGRIAITADTTAIEAHILQTLGTDVAIFGVTLLLLALTTWLVHSKTVAKPMALLQRSIERVKLDHVYEPVDWRSSDEIGRVVGAFNEMQVAQLEVEQEAKKRHQVFIDAVDPILIENLEGIVIDLNEEAELIYGWSREELLGVPIKTIVPADKHEQAEAFRHRCLQGEKVRNIAGERQAKDGSRMDVLLTLSRLNDEAGKPIAIATFAKDITELKRVERELLSAHRDLESRVEDRTSALQREVVERSSAEERFSALLQSTPDPIIIVDKTGTIMLANNRTTDMFGYNSGDLVGKTIETLIPRRYRADHPENRESFFATRIPREMGRGSELFAVGKDGEEFPVEISLSPIETAGDVLVAASVRDVTDRKQVERELREAKNQAEAAAQAKSAFLATMSHEIRTPMNGVVGMVDLLAQTSLDEDQTSMIRTTRDSAFSLLRIIDDILDFSKIEAGKMMLEEIPISVRDVVEGAAAMFAPAAQQKNLIIRTFIDPNIPQALVGDQVRLRQILINLIGNAIKFTQSTAGETGRIVVRAMLTDSEKSDMKVVRYSVIDNGIGMTAETVDRLFLPFSQAESSTTRNFGGTGLGLSICDRLCQMMNGEIHVTSEPGCGSEFAASIPHGNCEVAQAVERSRLTGVNVLTVAADKEGASIVKAYLEHWDATVTTVDKAEGLVPRMVEMRPGTESNLIVFLDANWSRDRCLSLIREVTACSELSDTRFVVHLLEPTGAQHFDDRNTVIALGHPLPRAGFLTAVAVAAGKASPEVPVQSAFDVLAVDKQVTVDEAQAKGQLILIAEDNKTNQDVILRQLKVLGYAGEAAEDGVEALAAIKSGKYSLLLTDCHMPRMDGFELTSAVRELEKDTGTRMPIIAITANALQGEADRCLAAGMDSYLSKPVEMKLLKTALAQFMPDVRNEKTETGPDFDAADSQTNEDFALLDLSFLRRSFGDDDETIVTILQDFPAAAEGIAEEVAAAFHKRTISGVRDAAHKLKSSAKAIGATDLSELCARAEAAAVAKNWSEVEEIFPQIRPAIRNITLYIRRIETSGTEF